MHVHILFIYLGLLLSVSDGEENFLQQTSKIKPESYHMAFSGMVSCLLLKQTFALGSASV